MLIDDIKVLLVSCAVVMIPIIVCFVVYKVSSGEASYDETEN